MIRSEQAPWMAEAACRGTGPDLFYPPAKGGDARQAKAICAECQVRLSCLEHAIEQHEILGVWGGMSARERARLRRVRSREKPINHGTAGGYLAHKKRSEQACAECRQAWSARNRSYRRAS